MFPIGRDREGVVHCAYISNIPESSSVPPGTFTTVDGRCPIVVSVDQEVHVILTTTECYATVLGVRAYENIVAEDAGDIEARRVAAPAQPDPEIQARGVVMLLIQHPGETTRRP